MIGNWARYTRAKVTIVCLLGVIIGLILLIINTLFQNKIALWQSIVLQELASLLIISATITALMEFVTRSDFLKELFAIENRLRSSFFKSENLGRLGNFGIVDCHIDGSKYDFSNFLNETQTLTVLVNDGKRWLTVNHLLLREYMAKPKSKTTFIMLNPGGHYISVLANKIGTTAEYQTNKVLLSCNRLIDLYKDIKIARKGDIVIYWIDLPVLNSIFFSDNLAILGPFNNSRILNNPQPFLIAANINSQNSYYHFIKGDLQKLIEDSKTVCALEAKNGKVKINSEKLGE